jgi:hypothetical protein
MPNSQYQLRWAVADSSRIYQDEYLEWSVARSAKKKDGTPLVDQLYRAHGVVFSTPVLILMLAESSSPTLTLSLSPAKDRR